MLKTKSAYTAIAFLLGSGVAAAEHHTGCISTGELVVSTLSGQPEPNEDLIASLRAFNSAQQQALDVKLQTTAQAYGVGLDEVRAQAQQKRDERDAILASHFGGGGLQMDMANLLIECVKQSSEVEMGQTQASFMATINEIRRMVGD